ncbi:unnamed protein product [Colletotrichum noveboracense]|uniref:Uncharacterized protein n=1 Tax=Colletotrichum noveboracense TaxID=2664923 RepID=A0A9W4S470_9PEZI|nr:unnamed protein product [Colletotrichum noveboracense]
MSDQNGEIEMTRRAQTGVDKLDLDDIYASLLPAVYRDAHENLIDPSASETIILECIDKELHLKRLADFHDWLWLAGRPMIPRPLHYQNLAGRQRQVTEQMDMHLVSSKPRIWSLGSGRTMSCKSDPSGSIGHVDQESCSCMPRRQRALGFLLSYVGFVSHQNDFIIAHEKHLLPRELNWLTSRKFVKELLDRKNIYREIDPRFH